VHPFPYVAVISCLDVDILNIEMKIRQCAFKNRQIVGVYTVQRVQLFKNVKESTSIPTIPFVV
jgi:hypothetical protein